MSVTLPPELEEFISDRVANGDYPSAEAVVAAGVGLLKAQEQQRVELRRDIDAAIRQIENGEYFEYDDESLDAFFEELKEKARRSISSTQP